MTFCQCCFIRTVPSNGITDRPVQICAACEPHYGNPAKTARDHGVMMEQYRDANASFVERLDDRRLALEAELAETQQQVATLTATIVSDYQERPAGSIQNVVEQDLLSAADKRLKAAVRLRDKAMGTVFRLTALHHEQDGACSCGRRLVDCAELSALESVRQDYVRWERAQLELLNAGRAHGLPLDHPAGAPFAARSWEWKGLPAT